MKAHHYKRIDADTPREETPRIQPKLYRRPTLTEVAPATTTEIVEPSNKVKAPPFIAATKPKKTVSTVEPTPPAVAPQLTRALTPVAPRDIWNWNGGFALSAIVAILAINLLLFWGLHATPTQSKLPLSIEKDVADLPYRAPRVIEYRSATP